eukprot:NODE_18416_length_212_cov_0.904459.p1 GENE.NODE_18416_length_212_cov_0.904459~~NODE_18416_length_212_cov_0.904459.p1  ORF type:complete len:51 (-),score=3.50 NODE_18416_length_212_cov_0.904459:60-212(-)
MISWAPAPGVHDRDMQGVNATVLDFLSLCGSGQESAESGADDATASSGMA